MSATDTRDAVETVLKLAGVDTATGGRTALPTARTREVIDHLCDTTPQEMFGAELGVDMRDLVRRLLDWQRPRASKAVVRTARRALEAETPDGVALWSHAIEALSYAAVWSPLLEPDRLDRVITHAAENAQMTTFAPIRYAAGPSAKLHALVAHYNPERLEMLAKSLWDAAHIGRWWDVCGGLGATGNGTKRRRKRKLTEEEREAEMEARTRAISTMVGEPAEAAADLIAGRTTHWNPLTAQLLTQCRLKGPALEEALVLAGEDHVDPDVNLLLAHLVDLPPRSRPQSPIVLMIDALEFLLADADPKSTLPKKPDGWGSLYPAGSLQEFPTPGIVKAWDWSELPNTPGAVIEIIRTPHALFENRDYMGNCTGGYNQRCQSGEWVLGKFHYNNELYNWSVCRDGATGWRTSEVNSRFNRGAVPAELRAGFNEFAALLSQGVVPDKPAPAAAAADSDS